jgi:hypothetical protein
MPTQKPKVLLGNTPTGRANKELQDDEDEGAEDPAKWVESSCEAVGLRVVEIVSEA